MNKNKSFSQYLLISLFIVLFFALSLSFIIIPDSPFSEDENRALSTAPEFSLQKLFFGNYTSDFSDYCSDQFPFRSFFVNLKALGELALFKGENNGIIVAGDGNLITDPGIANEELIKENLSHIEDFAKNSAVKVYTAFIPGGSYVLRETLPSTYPQGEIQKHYRILSESIPENVVNIDLAPMLDLHSSEYIYYKTDHHQTALGAYYTYCEVINALGKEPYSIDNFKRETVSQEFYGTTWSFAGIPFVKPDSLEFFRFDGDTEYTVEINGKETKKGLYDFTALETKDKYSAFVANTVNGYIKISSNENSETLIIFKDSFAHSIAPLLARHYNIIMIDTRYHMILRGSIDKLIEAENPSAVLFLMGAQGVFDNSGKLSALRNN